MRMSHVYQPVMLRLLLDRNGRVSISDIARALLNEDRSQLDYYSEITRNMVGRVLRLHGQIKKGGSFMGYDPNNRMTLVIWTNLPVSLDGKPTANSIMLKVLDQIYVDSPLR